MKRHRVGRSSAKLYRRNYEHLVSKGVDVNDPISILEYVKDLQITTQRGYILGTLRTLQALDKITEEEVNFFMDTLDEMGMDIMKDRNEKQINIPEYDFDKQLRKLQATIEYEENPRKLASLLQEKLVILVHTKIPARRGRDWYNMRIVAEPTEELEQKGEYSHNYINGEDFVFKDYKTKKWNGTQIVKPTEEIINTIEELLMARDEAGIVDGDFLFINGRNSPFKNPVWVKYLQKIFGFSTNMLRKIYVKDNIDISAVQSAREIAEKMGHTLETNIRDYQTKM